jgi:hypothetical protein
VSPALIPPGGIGEAGGPRKVDGAEKRDRAAIDGFAIASSPVDLPGEATNVDADPKLVADANLTRQQIHNRDGVPNVAAPIGVANEVGRQGVTSIPKGAPPPNMSSRHVLDNLEFFKAVKDGPGSGNSYLLQRPTNAQLEQLYGEAWKKLPTQQGNVTLSNGQTWSLNKTTGKFFPVGGPGIVSLTQQEVRLVEMAAKQIKSGTTPAQALENMGRAMGGQRYTVTPAMQTALESLGTKLGYSADDLGRAIAPHLPASANASVPKEAQAAAKAKAGGQAFRFVKWGGRTLLVVGLAMDAYEVYNAENKPKTITKKAGAWGASLGASALTAKAASPLLAGGPLGWIGYGAAVVGAGVGGYFLGGEVAETIYEWSFER